MSSLQPDGWLHAGRVGRPHGLDGGLNVTRPRAALLVAGATVRIEGAERTIVRRGGTEARPFVHLEGCESREQAEALRGADLLVAARSAPALEPGEFWPEQLEGCAVRDGHSKVGHVRAVVSLPSCEMLEVERSDGRELLVPLVSDAVRTVDLEAREIEIDLHFVTGA